MKPTPTKRQRSKYIQVVYRRQAGSTDPRRDDFDCAGALARRANLVLPAWAERNHRPPASSARELGPGEDADTSSDWSTVGFCGATLTVRGRTAGRVGVAGGRLGARTVGRLPDVGVRRTVGALLVVGRTVGALPAVGRLVVRGGLAEDGRAVVGRLPVNPLLPVVVVGRRCSAGRPMFPVMGGKLPVLGLVPALGVILVLGVVLVEGATPAVVVRR